MSNQKKVRILSSEQQDRIRLSQDMLLGRRQTEKGPVQGRRGAIGEDGIVVFGDRSEVQEFVRDQANQDR